MSLLGRKESQLFRNIHTSLIDIGRLSIKDNDSFTFTAYNGVLADTTALFGAQRDYLNITVLLSGKNCPDVNLARNTITSLPLETSCNLIRSFPISQVDRIFGIRDISEVLKINRSALVTTQEFWKILENHPDWENQIIAKEYFSPKAFSLSELEDRMLETDKVRRIGIKTSLYDSLTLAILKRHFTVWKEFSNDSGYGIILRNGKSNDEDFPVVLFFHSKEGNATLGVIKEYEINYYNQEHRFSLWLIKSRKELQNKVPEIYNNILTTMILGKEVPAIAKDLNDILDRLKQFPGNPFNISQELYLSESDFIKG